MLTGSTNAKGQGYKRIKATRANLSKNFLFNLQEGEYIVSNLFWSRNRPVFAEAVSPLDARHEQWRRIVSAKVDQRLCTVFGCKKDADEYLQSIIDPASESIDLNTGVRYRRAKLNREMFMAMPEGMSIVSSDFLLNGMPWFYLETSLMSEREALWKKIVEGGIPSMQCLVFHSQADMEEYLGHRGYKSFLEDE